MLDRIFMEDYEDQVVKIVDACVKDLGADLEKLKGTESIDHHFGLALSIRNKYMHKENIFTDADSVSVDIVKRLIFLADGGFGAVKYTTKRELLALLEGLDDNAQITLKLGDFTKTDLYVGKQVVGINEIVGPHGNKIIELSCEASI